MMADICTAAR